MAALVRHETLDKAVSGITEREVVKRRFPAPAYVHHLPGRLRLKAAEFRQDPIILEAACRELAALPGVRSASPNGLTGSILIEYDPRVSPPAELFESMQERGFPLISPEVSSLPGAEQMSLTEHLAGMAVGELFEWLVERLVTSAIAAVV